MNTKIKLTPSQKQTLILIKRKHQSSLIRDRAQAVLARNEGLTILNIAKALSRSDKFIRNAVYLYKKGRLDKTNLTSHNHKLLSNQRKEIIQMLQTKTPKDLPKFNFKTEFWSTDVLKEIIKKKYKVEYKSDQTYYNLFKQAGFSFHKPKTKDFRQDPKKIKKFKGALKKSLTTTKIRLSW
jgi:transposase